MRRLSDEFAARESGFHEAHGGTPDGYVAAVRYRPSGSASSYWAGPSSRRTALAVAAIVVGATVPAFTIVSMMNPAEPEFNAAAQAPAPFPSERTFTDPGAAGLAADDAEYLEETELPEDVARILRPEATGPSPAVPAAGVPAVAERSGRVTAPRIAAPALRQKVQRPKAVVQTRPTRADAEPTEQSEKAKLAEKTKRAAKTKPAEKTKAAERAGKQSPARVPATDKGATTLVEPGKSGAPAPKKLKAPKAAPDQPQVSFDPAEPQARPVAEDAPVARVDRSADAGAPAEDRRVAPRSVRKAPTVQTETADGPSRR